MAKKLGVVAQSVLKSIETFNSDVVEVEALTSVLAWDRGTVVTSLKEIEDAGYGFLTVGRRGQPSRFTLEKRSTGALVASDVPAASLEGGNESATQQQILILKRSNPVKISVPMDLTPEEAAKIIDWLKVISS